MDASPPPPIRFAWLIPSYACNKRCDFCYNGEEFLSDTSRASAGTSANMLRVLEGFAIEHITILGGEPLIYPHIEELVTAASGTSAKVSLVTNGTMFVTKAERQLWLTHATLDQVLVSLEPGPVQRREIDGATTRRRLPLVSQKTREPSWRDVIVALEDFPELPVRYVIKLFAHTVDSIPEMIETIAKSRHRRMLFSFGTAVVLDPQSGPPLLSPTELVSWYVELERLCAEVGIAPSFYMNLPLCMFPTSFLQRVVPESRASFGCSLLRGDSLVLDHHGNVAQCTHFMPLATDNVFAEETTKAPADVLAASWLDGEAARTRNALSVARHSACLDCPSFLRNCWGGCPILWSHFDPTDYIRGYSRTPV